MRHVLAAGVLGAFAGLATATAAPPGPLTDLEKVSLLTLDDALRRTDRASVDLAGARERSRQSALAVRRAWAVVQPRLSAAASYTRNNQEVLVDFAALTPPPPGTPVPEPAVIQRLNQWGAQAQLEQLLFNGQAIPLIQNAYDSREAAEAQLVAFRRDLLAQVTEAYFAALGAEALVGVADRQLVLAREQEDVTTARVTAGAALQSDALRARIDRLRAENDLVRARNALQQARVAIGTLARVQPEFALASPESVAITPPEGALEGLVERAIAERPEALVRRLEEEIAGRQVQAAWWALAPSLGLSGILRWTNAAGFGPNTTWALSVNLSVPIYDGGLRYADIAEAGSRSREAEDARISLERRIVEEIMDARLTLESARAQRENAKNAVQLARENSELLFTQYRAGTATRLELADSTTALRAAEAEFVRESVQVQLAALRLARSVGTFRPLEP